MRSRTTLGIAGPFARRYGDVKSGFILFPTWSIESAGAARRIQRSLAEHCERYREHRFLVLCSNQAETELLEQLKIPALLLNKNFVVSDRIFHPLDGSVVDLDAVYNARFVPVKRHELAAAVPRVGYVTYISSGRDQEFRDLYGAALARNPNHMLLNRTVDGLPVRLSKGEVNAVLGRAAVGLILSSIEGSSYATIEYLLAGLPVVSTPSKGGRDIYFDPDFCIVCEPDPRAVRDAVAALRERNIPRDVIRQRTLARIEPDRRRFLDIVNDLIEQLGGEPRYDASAWPFGEMSGIPWSTFEQHLDAFAARSGAVPAAATEDAPSRGKTAVT